jgi:hypothetical protein
MSGIEHGALSREIDQMSSRFVVTIRIDGEAVEKTGS